MYIKSEYYNNRIDRFGTLYLNEKDLIRENGPINIGNLAVPLRPLHNAHKIVFISKDNEEFILKDRTNTQEVSSRYFR